MMDWFGWSAEFDDPIFGVLDQFPDEWRALVLWREDRNRLSGPGQCHVEHPSFLCVMEIFWFGQDEIQDRVVDDLRRKAEPPGLRTENYDVIGFEPF